MDFQEALAILRRLRRAGHTAYFVGGCVRDRLLHRPVDEFDIATSALPGQVTALFPGANLVGAAFGVVLVPPHQVEVATFRTEDAYRDGRHPDAVRFETDPARDAARRDFTINGLFWDPESDEILDFTGGRADLASGIIRAIGDPAARFAEDHLRLLRAIRFAARLGFTIEPATFAALRECAHRIAEIAAERVREELTRILTEGGARRGFELLADSTLLLHTLPEIAACQGVAQPPEFHPEGDVWTHLLLMLEALREPAPELAWGVLLHDVGKPATFRVADRIRFDGHVEAGESLAARILDRLRFSAAAKEQILALIHFHMHWKHVREMRESRLKRFLRMPRFEEHLELHRLDCLASHGHLDNYEFARARLRELPPEQLRPPRLLTGEDLIAAGLTPGPRFRRLLAEIEDAQLEGRLRTREQALAWIRAQKSEAQL